MVVLAGRSACDRLNVLRPAPTRLVHLASDINLAEDHHLHTDQRLRDEFVRLVERLAHDGRPARIRRDAASAMDCDGRDDHDCDDVAHLDQRIDRRAGPVNVVIASRCPSDARYRPRASTRSTCKRQPESARPARRSIGEHSNTLQERNNPETSCSERSPLTSRKKTKAVHATPQVGACAGDLRPARPARALRHRASEPAPYTCCWHYGRTGGEIRDQRRRGRPR
jgi:hypothetical protein